MKLVFFVKSGAGTDVEMEHKDTVEKIKKDNLSAEEAADSIAEDHGEETDKKNPKKGRKKYYKALKKMEKKLKKSSSVDNAVMAFFRKKGNGKVKDSEIHALADRLGIDTDKVEETVYRLVQSKLKKSKSSLTFSGRKSKRVIIKSKRRAR